MKGTTRSEEGHRARRRKEWRGTRDGEKGQGDEKEQEAKINIRKGKNTWDVEERYGMDSETVRHTKKKAETKCNLLQLWTQSVWIAAPYSNSNNNDSQHP